MRMRTSGGREVRLERSERTLRQQRPAGRATKWRVILYHRPNSKSLLNEQAFLHLQLMRMRTSGGREVRLDVGLIRRVSVASGKCAGHCRMRRDRLIRPTRHTFPCQICAPYLTIH
ncbi:hypothetical protein P12B_c3674 [Escherichia coli P12b]|nr:hypothetical protein P12B_c3674 [Escherichia coli P12b]CAA26283.1 unnamed protein product [Escherichia coli]